MCSIDPAIVKIKLKSIIGALDLSKFSFININFNKKIYINKLFTDANNEKILERDEVLIADFEEKKDEGYSFSQEQILILNSVNKVHALNGSDYDFKKSYELALKSIKAKNVEDWANTAAMHLANAIQTGKAKLGINIFFSSFEIESDPQKQQYFIELKYQISYLYDKIQGLRHVDKDGRVKESVISDYEKIIYKKNEPDDRDCELILNDFQDKLLDLFENYKIKKYDSD